MSWLSDLFRKTLDQPHQHFMEAERDRLIAITSGLTSSRSPGSGVDSDPSPGLDTGAAFSPVAPVILNFGTPKHEGRN